MSNKYTHDPSASQYAPKNDLRCLDKGGPKWSTEEVAKFFGIHPHNLRVTMQRDPTHPAPTLAVKRSRGAIAYYWSEEDRNKLALWWTNRPHRASRKGAA